MRLTTADEDRSAAIAVTGGTAALLAAELLAGAGNVRALARAAAGARRFSSCQVTTRCRMSARGSTPNTASFSSMSPALAGVEGLNLDLHGLALLAFGRLPQQRHPQRGASAAAGAASLEFFSLLQA
jgi:uncharacterized protein YbjT (DUF2867 family)